MLKYTIGIRVSEEEELDGLDKTELGMEAYPEFSKWYRDILLSTLFLL